MHSSSREGPPEKRGFGRNAARAGGAVALSLGILAGPLAIAAQASVAPHQTTAAAVSSIYVPLATPIRVEDTRTGSGLPGAGDAITAGGKLHVLVSGTGALDGVPASATAIVANVTAVTPTAAGYFSVYPTGSEPSPLTSNLNFKAGENDANLVTVTIGTGGDITILNDAGTANALVDVYGYYTSTPTTPPSGLYTPVSPYRALGTLAVGATAGPGSNTPVTVTGGSTGVPADATAVVVNVTVAHATAPSFVTAYGAPALTSEPTFSTVNFTPGPQVVANRATVPVGTGGQIEIYNHAGTADVDVDIDGYYSGTGASFVALSSPYRVTDTRVPTNGTPIAATTTETFNLSPTGSPVPATASAVAANFTVVSGDAAGYATIYPVSDTTNPVASDINWMANEAVPNFTIADTAGTGTVDVYASHGAAVNLVIDEFGYFTPITVPVVTAYTLSPITVTGQTVGTGAAATPAVSEGSANAAAAPLTLTATLTDTATSAPAAGIATTLVVITSGGAPTVTSGTATLTASPLAGGGGYSFTVPTSSTGQAVATLAEPTGVAASYTTYYEAPVIESNGQPLSDAPAYLEFVPQNTVGISPFGTEAAPYTVAVSSPSDETTGLIPVTITLPPLDGSPQANIPVFFTMGSDFGTAFFASATGSEIDGGSSYQGTYTNAEGQATVYVNNNTAGEAEVLAGSVNNFNASNAYATTHVEWGQPGIPISVTDITGTGTTGGLGTKTTPFTEVNGGNATITGTAVDATGTPVADTTLLITSMGGQGAYVTGSGTTATTTRFPNATPIAGSTVTSTGAPYGELVTTNASGQYSFTVTDYSETDTFNVWPVANGVVQSSVPLTGGTTYVQFLAQTSTVAAVVVAPGNDLSSTLSSPSSALTGVNYSTAAGGLVEYGALDGSGNDFLVDNPTSSVTYQVSATNSGFLSSVDGIPLNGTYSDLPNTASAIAVTVSGSYDAGTGVETSSVFVNGVLIGQYTATGCTVTPAKGTTPASTSCAPRFTIDTSSSLSGFALPTDVAGNPNGAATTSFVNVGVFDGTAETDVFTAAVNSLSATATIGFTPGVPNGLSASPAINTEPAGTSVTETFTASYNGTPLADTSVEVSAASLVTNGTAEGLWITAVNGTALTQADGPSGDTEATPIPLYTPTLTPSYTSVTVPGAVAWSSTGKSKNLVTFTTGSKGTFTVTFLDKNVQYWTSGTTVPSTDSTSGSVFNGTLYVTSGATSVTYPGAFQFLTVAPPTGTAALVLNYEGVNGIAAAADPTSVASGNTSTITAKVTNSTGAVSGDTVSFAAAATAGTTCTLASASASTDAKGDATDLLTTGGAAGTCSVTATDSTNAVGGTATVTVTNGPAMVSAAVTAGSDDTSIADEGSIAITYNEAVSCPTSSTTDFVYSPEDTATFTCASTSADVLTLTPSAAASADELTAPASTDTLTYTEAGATDAEAVFATASTTTYAESPQTLTSAGTTSGPLT